MKGIANLLKNMPKDELASMKVSYLSQILGGLI